MNTNLFASIPAALSADLAARLVRVDDRLRCHDFPGREGVGPCFVEGYVEGYAGGEIRLRVTRDVFDGQEVPRASWRSQIRTFVNLGHRDWVGRIEKL